MNFLYMVKITNGTYDRSDIFLIMLHMPLSQEVMLYIIS